MVLLKNIKKTENDISADYYPEGKGSQGFMRISLSDGKIIEEKNRDMFSAAHVRRELKRLADMENPPSEKTVLWY